MDLSVDLQPIEDENPAITRHVIVKRVQASWLQSVFSVPFGDLSEKIIPNRDYPYEGLSVLIEGENFHFLDGIAVGVKREGQYMRLQAKKVTAFPWNNQTSENETVFVTKIIDGDTIVANGEHIRLLGIDTDEKGNPCYNEAKEKLEEYILNKEVILERDREDKDQYGRLLRYIFLDGENINLKLVEEGLAIARFYPENVKYKEEIINAEKEARKNKIGCMWKNIS